MATEHTAHAAHGHDAHGHDEHHIVEPPTYYKIFAWLMILLIVTLGAAMVDLGPLNLPLAMVIAVAKAALVMAVFMHLKWNSVVVRMFALCAFFWLIIMFWLTMNDYATRGWLAQ